MIALLRRLVLVLAVCLAAASPAHVARAHGALALTAAHDVVAAIGALGADEEGSIGRGFLRGRAGAAAWTPATPGNLIAWYDCSDLTTLFSSNACTGATSNAGTIGCITDKSGNGRSVTQATAGNRPVRTDSTQNGLTACTFASANSTWIASGSFTIAQPATIVVWMKGYGNAAGYLTDGGATADVRDTLFDSVSNPAHAGIYSGGGASTYSSNTVDPTTAHMVLGNFNGASSIVRLDGTETGSLNPGSAADTTGITLGAAGSHAAAFYTGNILEVAIYSVTLSSGDRTSAQTYGQGKWATP